MVGFMPAALQPRVRLNLNGLRARRNPLPQSPSRLQSGSNPRDRDQDRNQGNERGRREIDGGGAGGGIRARERQQAQSNFGTAGSLRERIKNGEAADLVILSESAIAELAKSGLVLPDTR